MSDRARGWCLTLNNYDDISYTNLCDWMRENTEYGVIGKEVGESGTPHLQIYFEFKNMKSFKQLKSINKKLHIEKRLGTKTEAADYCKKDGNFVEFGELKCEQGKRNDIDMVRAIIKNGGTMKEVCDHASGYQSIKCGEIMRKYYCRKRNWKPTVYWYYGETGTGKSASAISESDPNDRWISMDSLKWWDGYDGESDVIIDDFRASDCRLKTLLRILDRYEYKVETKGGSTQLLARRIWITCPYAPNECYRSEGEDMKQLIRRIDYVKEFTRDSTRHICNDDELSD